MSVNTESEITESEKAALMKELDIEPNTMVLGNVGYFGYQKKPSIHDKSNSKNEGRKFEFCLDFCWCRTRF